MSIDMSKLAIDSRDYLSIFKDLQTAVSDLTELWTCSNENDPGVILVKLMAMYGDMLSYNLDRATIELYESTVTQRRNAQKIFELIGYKMHWYKSAVCTAHLNNTSSSDLTLPKLTTFLALDNATTYTYFGSNNTGNISLSAYSTKDIELIQGIPITPQLLTDKIADSNSQWHSIYDFNVIKDNIINNYIYLPESKIDQDHIYLVDSNGITWNLVDSIDMLEKSGKYFEFNVDDEDKPYIRLVEYWQQYNVVKFKLFLIKTLGSEGSINANMLNSTANSKIVRFNGNSQIDATNSVVVTNDPSTAGHDFESSQEARETSKNYINTFDTLITIDDFTKATKRIDGVSNCMCTDITNDPGYHDLSSNSIVLYVTRSDDYTTITDEVFRSFIKSELKSNKLLPINIIVDFDNIKYYKWKISGTINLVENVSLSTSQSILVDINNMLNFNYDYSKIAYNYVPSYYDIISIMKEANDNISSIDLNPITIVDSDGNEVDKATITGQYSYSFIPESEIIDIVLPMTPIKPKSIIIRINGSQHLLYDNGSGNIISSSSILAKGTISYVTGAIHIELVSLPKNSTINIAYNKNVINIVKFAGVDILTLMIDQDYIEE